MSLKDFSAGLIGTSMAVGPSMAAPHFYETNTWLSAIAIVGAIVLCLALINGVVTLRRNIKGNTNKEP